MEEMVSTGDGAYRTLGGNREERVAWLLELKEKGYSMTEITDIMGRSRTPPKTPAPAKATAPVFVPLKPLRRDPPRPPSTISTTNPRPKPKTPKGVQKTERGKTAGRMGGGKTYNLDAARAAAERLGGKCESPEWPGSHGRLALMCSEGHRWTSFPSNLIMRGSWCPTCHKTRGAKTGRNQEDAKPMPAKTARRRGDRQGPRMDDPIAAAKARAMLAEGMTQTRVAKAMGVSQSTVSIWHRAGRA